MADIFITLGIFILIGKDLFINNKEKMIHTFKYFLVFMFLVSCSGFSDAAKF